MSFHALGTTIDPNMTVRMTLIARFNKLTAARPRTPSNLKELESIHYELGKNHWTAIYQDYPRMGSKITEYKQALISTGEIISTGNALGDWKVTSTPRPITQTQTRETLPGNPSEIKPTAPKYSWIGWAALAGIAFALLSSRR